MIGPEFPRLMIDLSPNLALPSIARLRIGGRQISCGTGFDREIIVRAAGEALERQMGHSALAEPGERLAPSSLAPDIFAWLRRLSIDREGGDIETEDVAVVSALDVASGERCLFPSVAFTLGSHPDSEIMPLRDSSGSALHRSAGLSQSNAIAELAERQALSCFWYGGHILSASVINDQSGQNIAPNLRSMISVMNAIGEVYVIDISLISPYRTYLAVFFNSSGPVYMASGASAHESASVAIQKALTELYQAFTLMHQLVQAREKFDISDEQYNSIVDEYYEHNNYETIKRIQKIFNKIKIIKTGSLYPSRLNFKFSLDDLNVISWSEVLEFPQLGVDCYFTKCVAMNGFPVMSSMKMYPNATKHALRCFNFSRAINFDSVPFG